MDLFTPVAPLFSTTKLAAMPLDEDPAKWSAQILQELFRCCPDASEYNPQVVMMRQDPEQGFAYGVIVVSGQTDSALSNAGGEQSTSKRALIPFIIKNNELCPLDTLLTEDRKFFPLTGQRLREALFRPNTFDMMTDDQGDNSLYSMFYPPGRSSNSPTSGFAGGGGDSVGYVYGPGMKTAEDLLMTAIAPTLSQNDLNALSEKIATEVPEQLRANPAFMAVVAKLAQFDGKLLTDLDANILMDKAASYAPVEVAQFGWDPVESSYWMKVASRSLYALRRDPLTRSEILKLAGKDVVDKVDQEGTVTMAEPSGATPFDATAEKWELIEKPGIYKVRSGENELIGWVLPSLIDFDGTSVPMAVFTNGAVAAVQGQIAGVKVADPGLALPDAKPQGSGLFYMMTPNGVQATVPVRIAGSEGAMDGSNVIHAVSLTGQPVRIKFVEGLQAMIPGQEETALPAFARFLPLNSEAPVPLMDEVEATKAASMNSWIEVRHGGDVIDLTFHGLPGFEATTPKVASIDDAIFTLCAAGMSPMHAHNIIKKAELSMRTEHVIGVKDVRPVETFMADIEKTAHEKVAAVHALRRELVKEASVLPDIQTVDSVLSLNYINPENIRTYVSKLPYLDRALNSLCELTLFSRLGMSEVPEHAASRAARAVDEVIQGLKGLAMRGVDTPASSTAAAP